MLRAELDHITVVAPTLAVGTEFVSRKLGVTPRPGGEHPRMGTHNCLLKLGPKIYLEVIAINPNAKPPPRVRWYGLDRLRMDELPRIATWIGRTNNINAAASSSPVSLGKVEEMTRGTLNWRITIPSDGILPLDGVAPSLIQWPAEVHPTDLMPDSECELIRLEGFHPNPSQVYAVLAAIGFEGEFGVSELPHGRQPYLAAHIQSPAGPVIL